MSTAQRVVFEGGANPLLKELGYEAYNTVPKSPLGYVHELRCFLDRGGRFRRLTARLGIKRKSKLERGYREALRSIGEEGYHAMQQKAFGSLVKDGIYDAEFEHARQARAFFQDCMSYAYAQVGPDNGLSILDCGCGPGAWLDFVYRMDNAENASCSEYYGFDITPEMIDVARCRLGDRVPARHLRQGDILKDESYVFEQDDQRYQIIYAYDVVQQLPRKLQFAACKAMLRRLAPGGLALIFDHDRHSSYGRKMGFKKFVTQYLKVDLVPRYYCNARYPALARLADKIEASGQFTTEIKVAPDGIKRALMIRSRSA